MGLKEPAQLVMVPAFGGVPAAPALPRNTMLYPVHRADHIAYGNTACPMYGFLLMRTSSHANTARRASG